MLGLTALATSIAPAPQRNDSPAEPPPQSPPVTPPTTIELRAPGNKPFTKAVAHDARVVVEAVASEGGQVEIPALGQVQAVGADATARFDLFGLSPGRYDIMFEPALGTPVRIATLVSR